MEIKKIKRLQTFDLRYFIGKSYFDDDWSQNYLIFQLVFTCFQTFGGTVDKILEWKSEGLPVKSITTPATSGNSQSLFIIS